MLDNALRRSDQATPKEVVDRIGPVMTDLESLSADQIAASIFFVAFLCDSAALPVIREIGKHGGVLFTKAFAKRSN